MQVRSPWGHWVFSPASSFSQRPPMPLHWRQLIPGVSKINQVRLSIESFIVSIPGSGKQSVGSENGQSHLRRSHISLLQPSLPHMQTSSSLCPSSKWTQPWTAYSDCMQFLTHLTSALPPKKVISHFEKKSLKLTNLLLGIGQPRHRPFRNLRKFSVHPYPPRCCRVHFPLSKCSTAKHFLNKIKSVIGIIFYSQYMWLPEPKRANVKTRNIMADFMFFRKPVSLLL